jgi:Ca-activated chloride channel family protein
VPAYRSDDALVVALDLSRSMDAADVEPSRLARAKLKLIDLLERRADGQTALVVFSANAFTVTPLTSDTKTIAALIGALGTDIMPSQGSLLDVGLDKAAALLRQAAAREGEILLITDAVPFPAAFDLAGALSGEGIRTHVLAVGTQEGAPIPTSGGGFLTDGRGQVVVPQVNPEALRRLAERGGGRFARLAVGGADLDRLFPSEAVVGAAIDADGESREADVWRDRGIWLTLALLPLVAVGFRRGWVYLLVLGFALPAPRAEAFEWRDLWQRPDQRGSEALRRAAPDEAAGLFVDPEWRAAALYRAGRFEQSAATLNGIDTAAAHYNQGNGLARAGRPAEAIEAYDRALELEPDHADAAYNKALVSDLLEQQQREQSQQGQQDARDGQDPADASAAEQAAEDQGQASARNAGDPGGAESEQAGAERPQGEREAEAAQGDERGEQPPGSGRAESEAEQAPAEEPGEALQAALDPEELEDWASEQAADQWLRRIPQDPGGLLRRKFLYQYQQLGIDQDGNAVRRGDLTEPW